MTTAVAVNLLWLAPGRVGGSEEYLVRQLSGLHAAAPDDIALTLYCQGALRVVHPQLAAMFPTSVPVFDRDVRAVRIAAEHTWLALRTRHADIVHHGGGTAPMIGSRPIALTVHDLQYLTFPEYFSRGRLAYLRAMMRRSIERATVVTTPSAYVRDTVVEAFGTDPDAVVVVPHGIPHVAKPTEAAVSDARRRCGVPPPPYVIYPAITHPHKAHRVLIEMLAATEPDLGLVLLGGEGAAEHDLRARIANAGVGDRVVRLGRVSASDRDALVAGAEALVFPSVYEGFGAPLVEAMALDTPVVCSDQPAMREVVGDAAIIVGEESADGWAAAVEAVRVPARREQLVAAGRERRTHYTQEISGATLADAYRLAARP